MKRLWILGITGALGGMLGCLYFAHSSAAEADPLDHVLTLSPEPDVIRREIAARSAANPQMTDAERRKLFAELFTQRFRIHDSKMAVRARFVPAEHGQDRIKLMCPARMEPWNMDRVALDTWREAQVCLGHAYDVDIYETFIGALPVKIGELRSSGDKTPVASIRYTPSPDQVTFTTATVLFPTFRPAAASMHPSSHNPANAPLQARGVQTP